MPIAGALVAAACGGDDAADTAAEPTADTSGMPAASPTGTSALPECHDFDASITPDEPGYETQEEAFAAQARSLTSLAGATLSDGVILLDGAEIGSATFIQSPAGGWLLERAEWCPPHS